MSSRRTNQDQPVKGPVAAPDQIVGAVLHTVLQAIHDLSGPQYPTILRAAGLSRFIDTLPPLTAEPVASRDELEHLYSSIYEMLGESLTRLFMRNYGQRLAAQMLETKAVQEMIGRVSALAPPQRHDALVHELVQFASRGWTAMRLSQDAQYWYIEMERCPNCAGIHGASAPLCQGPIALYNTLAKVVIGRAMPVTEVTCAATGDAHCKFALSK